MISLTGCRPKEWKFDIIQDISVRLQVGSTNVEGSSMNEELALLTVCSHIPLLISDRRICLIWGAVYGIPSIRRP